MKPENPYLASRPVTIYVPTEVNTPPVDELACIPRLRQALYHLHLQPPNSVPRSPTSNILEKFPENFHFARHNKIVPKVRLLLFTRFLINTSYSALILKMKISRSWNSKIQRIQRFGVPKLFKVVLGISRTNVDSQWNPVYNTFHRIFVVETKRFVGSFVNMILTRQTCGQRSSRAAESKRRALGKFFPERICYMFQISKCRGDWDLGLSTISGLAFGEPMRSGDFRIKHVFRCRKNRILYAFLLSSKYSRNAYEWCAVVR